MSPPPPQLCVLSVCCQPEHQCNQVVISGDTHAESALRMWHSAPLSPLWHYIEGSLEAGEDNEVTLTLAWLSRAHTLLSCVSTAQSCDSCFPPAEHPSQDSRYMSSTEYYSQLCTVLLPVMHSLTWRSRPVVSTKHQGFWGDASTNKAVLPIW